jgi:hypothetical protein
MARSAAARRAWVAAGSVLAVPFVGFGTLQVVTSLAHETEAVTLTFDAADLDGLDMHGQGNVTVVGADVDGVTVSLHIQHGLRRTGHTERVAGRTLVLRSTCPSVLSQFCRVDTTVEVPRHLAVTVNSDDYHVELTGLEGDLDIENDNARIVGTGLRSRHVRVQNDNSGIELEFVEPPETIEAENDNADIVLRVPNIDAGYAVQTETNNGSAETHVRTDPSATRTIVADNDNGDIRILPR